MPITDPADRIDAYYERLAKVLECGDLTETEAHLTATTEVGGTLEDLAQLQATFWRHKVEMLLQSNDPALATLLRRLCVIVRQPWFSMPHGLDGAAATYLASIPARQSFELSAGALRAMQTFRQHVDQHATVVSSYRRFLVTV